MASWLRALGRTASRAVSAVPGARAALRLLPGVSTAYAAYDIASAAFSGGGGGPAMPMLPGFNGTGPAGGGPIPGMGERSIFRNDPNVIAALKPYAISMANLKTFYRAPRGAIILRDEKGEPFGVPKAIAKAWGLWKPAKKPPISVRQWSAMQHVRATMKTLRRIEGTGRQLARLAAPRGSFRRGGNTVPFSVVETTTGTPRQTVTRRAA